MEGRMEPRRERISCSWGPSAPGPLGRETACYGEHSGLGVVVVEVGGGSCACRQQQIKHPCVTCLTFLSQPVETDLRCAFVRTSTLVTAAKRSERSRLSPGSWSGFLCSPHTRAWRFWTPPCCFLMGPKRQQERAVTER